DKSDFVGRNPIARSKEIGLSRQLVGLRLLDRGIPRQGYEVFSSDGSKRVGVITSGTQSPSVRQAIGLAYVESSLSALGTRLTVAIRGGKIAAEIVSTPFYKRDY